jgi:CHAT domain-containing protein/Tfp pilus assembly protein PilF
MEQRMRPRTSAHLAGLLALALLGRAGSAQPPPTGPSKPPPLSAPQQACQQERAQLHKEVNQLLKEGKSAEALALWQKHMTRLREAFKDPHEQVERSLLVLLQVHESREDFPAAARVWEEIAEVRSHLYGKSDWRVKDARLLGEYVTRLGMLGREGRARLAKATALGARATNLLEAERAREALPLVQEALAVHRELLGEGHPLYALSLTQLGRIHISQGEHARARALYWEALSIYAKSLGESYPGCVPCLMYLADLHATLGEYGKARSLAERALDLRKRAVGENHPSYALTLNVLAVVSEGSGDYAGARDAYERSLRILKATWGERHPGYANALEGLAQMYLRLGKYAQARDLAEKVLALRKETLGEAHRAYATGLYNLGKVYANLGEHTKARASLEQALALIRKIHGENHLYYAHVLHGLGIYYWERGEYARARALLEQTLDLRKKLQGTGHPDYAGSLTSLAQVARATGEYGKARAHFEESLRLQKKARRERHPDYLVPLSELGNLHKQLGDYVSARVLLERVVEESAKILGESHPEYAAHLRNLADLYREMGEDARARTLFERSLDLTKKALGEDHPHVGNALNNLAMLYLDGGDHAKARRLLELALDNCKKALGERHPNYPSRLRNLASIHRDAGDYPRARALIEQARKLSREILGERHPHYARALFDEALVPLAAGDAEGTADLAWRALLWWHAPREEMLGGLGQRQRLEALFLYQGALNVYLSSTLAGGTGTTQPYLAVLTWKGALTARSAEERLARERPELQPLVQQLRAARSGLARLVSLTPAGEAEQRDWRERFDRLEQEKERLEALLAEKSAAYLRWRELRQVEAAQVADALPPQTALVEFVQYLHVSPPPEQKGFFHREERLLAFVLVRGREPVLVRLGPAEPINKAVQSWREAINKLRPQAKEAAELSRLIWQPLGKHLGGVRTVLIAPDGVVSSLPFAALPGRKPGSYLLEELTVGYVPSGRHLLDLTAEKEGPRAQGLLAVGGLHYGEPPAKASGGGKSAYRYLPGTQLEVERLAGLYGLAFPSAPPPRLLSGDKVDAAHLKDQLLPAGKRPRPRYLHLATHGLFEAPSAQVQRLRWPRDEAMPFGLAREYRAYVRNPLLLSGLVLAGANADPEKGVLRGLEVADLDLRGCELAVLSACDTGLGKAAAGEGVLGLQRAFQEAGARSVTASLWKVQDAATSVLMEEFYANLWQKKLPRLEALRQAQLTVLREPARVQQRQKELQAELARRGERGPEDGARPLPEGGPRSHPALWAAFVLSGDGGPLPDAKTELRNAR